jgi:hypothetical protein
MQLPGDGARAQAIAGQQDNPGALHPAMLAGIRTAPLQQAFALCSGQVDRSGPRHA